MALTSPLFGVKVLDLSRAVSGPYAGRILADLGADVVKVESPEGDLANGFGRLQAGRSGLFAQMNVGKRNIVLDFRNPADVDTCRALASAADVVVENFRPGVLDQLRLGYAALSELNQRLVMLSISGFGASSPEAQRRAFAPTLHAESGMLVRQARLDERMPADLGMSVADTLAGLHGAIAVLAALRLKDETGRGQWIDLSMLDAVVASDDQVHQAIEGAATSTSSRGQIFELATGPVIIAASLHHIWHRLAVTFGLHEDGDASASVAVKAERRRSAIDRWLKTFETKGAMCRAVEQAGLSWADVRPPEALLDEPSLQARPPYEEVDDGGGGLRRVVRMPYRIGEWTAQPAGRVAPHGADRDSVLDSWLGA
jgi:CoA:oxalate CoA-transferase